MTSVRHYPPTARQAHLGAPHRHRTAAIAFGVATAVLAVSGCAFGPPPPDEPGTVPHFPQPSVSLSPSAAATTVDTIAGHLVIPWAIAFAPDNSALITERDSGKIYRLGPAAGPDGLTRQLVRTVTDITPGGGGGLLGLAVSPDYTTDHTIFVYYSTAQDNRIASLRLDPSGTSAAPPTPIVTGIPHGSSDNGGALAFGPDGLLYAGTGDAGTKATAQNRASLAGKVLRMTRAGKPAPGNPTHTLAYGFGFRNVQALTWDESNRLYVTDMGEDDWSEVDLVSAGADGGWPTVSGDSHDPRFLQPVAAWAGKEATCPGVAASGNLLVTACLHGSRMYLMQLTGTGTILGAPQVMLPDKFGRLRTVVRAPDGSLWVSTSNRDGQGQPQPLDDQILRVIPGNSPRALS